MDEARRWSRLWAEAMQREGECARVYEARRDLQALEADSQHFLFDSTVLALLEATLPREVFAEQIVSAATIAQLFEHKPTFPFRGGMATAAQELSTLAARKDKRLVFLLNIPATEGGADRGLHYAALVYDPGLLPADTHQWTYFDSSPSQDGRSGYFLGVAYSLARLVSVDVFGFQRAGLLRMDRVTRFEDLVERQQRGNTCGLFTWAVARKALSTLDDAFVTHFWAADPAVHQRNDDELIAEAHAAFDAQMGHCVAAIYDDWEAVAGPDRVLRAVLRTAFIPDDDRPVYKALATAPSGVRALWTPVGEALGWPGASGVPWPASAQATVATLIGEPHLPQAALWTTAPHTFTLPRIDRVPPVPAEPTQRTLPAALRDLRTARIALEDDELLRAQADAKPVNVLRSWTGLLPALWALFWDPATGPDWARAGVTEHRFAVELVLLREHFLTAAATGYTHATVQEAVRALRAAETPSLAAFIRARLEAPSIVSPVGEAEQQLNVALDDFTNDASVTRPLVNTSVYVLPEARLRLLRGAYQSFVTPATRRLYERVTDALNAVRVTMRDADMTRLRDQQSQLPPALWQWFIHTPSKARLAEAIWESRFVTDPGVVTAVRELRRAVDATLPNGRFDVLCVETRDDQAKLVRSLLLSQNLREWQLRYEDATPKSSAPVVPTQPSSPAPTALATLARPAAELQKQEDGSMRRTGRAIYVGTEADFANLAQLIQRLSSAERQGVSPVFARALAAVPILARVPDDPELQPLGSALPRALVNWTTTDLAHATEAARLWEDRFVTDAAIAQTMLALIPRVRRLAFNAQAPAYRAPDKDLAEMVEDLLVGNARMTEWMARYQATQPAPAPAPGLVPAQTPTAAFLVALDAMMEVRNKAARFHAQAGVRLYVVTAAEIQSAAQVLRAFVATLPAQRAAWTDADRDVVRDMEDVLRAVAGATPYAQVPDDEPVLDASLPARVRVWLRSDTPTTQHMVMPDLAMLDSAPVQPALERLERDVNAQVQLGRFPAALVRQRAIRVELDDDAHALVPWYRVAAALASWRDAQAGAGPVPVPVVPLLPQPVPRALPTAPPVPVPAPRVVPRIVVPSAPVPVFVAPTPLPPPRRRIRLPEPAPDPSALLSTEEMYVRTRPVPPVPVRVRPEDAVPPPHPWEPTVPNYWELQTPRPTLAQLQTVLLVDSPAQRLREAQQATAHDEFVAFAETRRALHRAERTWMRPVWRPTSVAEFG